MESLTPSYQWALGTTILGYSETLSLHPGMVSPNDIVSCMVSVSDGAGALASGSTTIQLINRDPILSNGLTNGTFTRFLDTASSVWATAKDWASTDDEHTSVQINAACACLFLVVICFCFGGRHHICSTTMTTATTTRQWRWRRLEVSNPWRRLEVFVSVRGKYFKSKLFWCGLRCFGTFPCCWASGEASGT